MGRNSFCGPTALFQRISNLGLTCFTAYRLSEVKWVALSIINVVIMSHSMIIIMLMSTTKVRVGR